jgi:hypothetical protein
MSMKTTDLFETPKPDPWVKLETLVWVEIPLPPSVLDDPEATLKLMRAEVAGGSLTIKGLSGDAYNS